MGDLPSFVSGDHLVVLDPHAAFLPGASASKPGLKIKFTSETRESGESGGLLSQFPDQFAGYRGLFGCDFRGAYDGTLFRFPLRSEETAREFFAAFKKNAARSLL